MNTGNNDEKIRFTECQVIAIKKVLNRYSNLSMFKLTKQEFKIKKKLRI